jgi:hypothetical protein
MSLRMKTLVVFTLPVAAALAACGGAELSELFGNPGGAADGGVTTDAQAQTDTEPPPPPFDASIPDSEVANDTSVPVPDAGVRDTGIADTGVVDTGIADAGRDAPRVITDSNGILCGSSGGTPNYCETGVNYCCATRQVNVGAFTAFSCIATNVACDGVREARFECDGPEDCSGGKVCCGDYVLNPLAGPDRWDSTSCTTAAACDGQFRTVIGNNAGLHDLGPLCKPAAAVDECPNPLTCRVSSTPAYGYCR